MPFLPQTTKSDTLTLTSAGFNYQIPAAFASNAEHKLVVTVSSPSSLVGAAFVVKELFASADPNSGTWVAVPQAVAVLASGGGTPNVITGNTATATAIVGGVSTNATGVTTVTNTLTAVFVVRGCGAQLRLEATATSGTANVVVEYQGLAST